MNQKKSRAKGKEIFLKYKGKKIKLNVEPYEGINRYIGLMFMSKKNSKVLLFDSKSGGWWAIHSWFVFFPFLAIWTDGKYNIIEMRIVKPFTFLVKPKKSFNKLVEIPLTEKFLDITKKLSYRRV